MTLQTPGIPKAFMLHDKIMQILGATVHEFGHDEQCAIQYHYCADLPPHCIATAVQLSERHVVSAIELFAARLSEKINFFRKVHPCSESEELPVRDVLMIWDA